MPFTLSPSFENLEKHEKPLFSFCAHCFLFLQVTICCGPADNILQGACVSHRHKELLYGSLSLQGTTGLCFGGRREKTEAQKQREVQWWEVAHGKSWGCFRSSALGAATGPCLGVILTAKMGFAHCFSPLHASLRCLTPLAHSHPSFPDHVPPSGPGSSLSLLHRTRIRTRISSILAPAFRHPRFKELQFKARRDFFLIRQLELRKLEWFDKSYSLSQQIFNKLPSWST